MFCFLYLQQYQIFKFYLTWFFGLMSFGKEFLTDPVTQKLKTNFILQIIKHFKVQSQLN